MRIVVTNQEVVHLWAHQSQPEARNSKGSLFFEGDTLYSYGYHYPIARHCEEFHAVLFNAEHSSTTTESHKSMAMMAVSHLEDVFTVPNLDCVGSQENMDWYREEVEKLLKKSMRARTNTEFYYDMANRMFEEAQRYAEVFGLAKLDKRALFDEAALKSAVAKASEARKIRRKKEMEKFINETLPKFKRGEVRHITDPVNSNRAYLRVHTTGNDRSVFTSKGITIGEQDARKVWRLASHVRKLGEAFVPKEYVDIAGFGLDKITAKGDVHAGCHSVPYEEIEYAAKGLGFIK